MNDYQKENYEDPYEKGFADKLYEDFIPEKPTYESPDRRTPAKKAPARKRRKKKSIFKILCKTLLALVLLLGITLVVLHFYAEAPGADSLAVRKEGSATILLAGTDESGDRTDTIMLMNIDRNAGRISLMSIPRDTKVNSSYWPHKINIAYGVNGKGHEGMDSLMGYVQDCVGFRPDGYVLLELDVFIELVDLFGGVEFNVPCQMDYDDPSQDLSIHLEPGLQELDGKQAMGLVRFRSGYTMQDLERVNVQRDFLLSAMDQWASPMNVLKLLPALRLLKDNATTDLSTKQFLWLAESVLLCGTSDLQTVTIPNDQCATYFEYVLIEGGEAYFDLINTYFNPYEKNITWEDLDLAY